MTIKELIKEERVFDPTMELKDNAMLKVRPDLFNEWDFEKNDELELNIYNVSKGSNKKAWWFCLKCDSNYDSQINVRSRGGNCPYCAGRKVNGTNSLATLNPELSSEWHPNKNGSLTPQSVACGSSEKVWWIGKCGHEWEATIASRAYNKNGCKTCDNKQVLIGFNDMWTTNPELAKLLINPDDGYRYTEGSKQKANWKCLNCGEEVKNKPIKEIKRRGLSCPNCSDGSSLPEKIMYHLLRQLEVELIMESSFEWSNGKRYDFYIQSLSMIVEMHGGQHYGFGFEQMSGETLKEVQENDAYKLEMALVNGIEKYIIIDCRKSEFNFIKSNIIGSELNKFFDFTSVEWDDINLNSQRSLHFELLELWNKGLSLVEISDKTKFHKHTVAKILKKFESLGKCVYDSRRANNKALDRKKTLVIYQLDKNYNIIKRWNNVNEIAAEITHAKKKTISNSCRENRIAYGFYWRYERDMGQIK